MSFVLTFAICAMGQRQIARPAAAPVASCHKSAQVLNPQQAAAIIMDSVSPEFKQQYVKSLANQCPRGSARLANAETELILEENFDLMEDGSPDDIDTSFDLSGYVTDFENGIADPDNIEIDPDFTHTPGWTGQCVYQAGGAVALYYPDHGGILNTPCNLNLNGVIRVSFRCRTASDSPCIMIVTPCCHDWYNIEMATDHRVYINTFYPADGWTDVEFEIDVPYEGNDAFIQFNALTYSDGVIIDDLKIERVLNKIMEPYSVATSLFTDDGFTLSWKGDPKSDGYVINLWETNFDPNGSVSAFIDFDEIEYDEDNMQVTDFKLPEGWNIELNDQHPEVGLNPTDGSPGILFYEDLGRYYSTRWLPIICTPTGSLVSEFKCQIVVVAENTVAPSSGGDPYTTEWRLYGVTDTGSSKLLTKGEIANVLNTVLDFDISNTVNYYNEVNDYSNQYYGFELELWPSNDGAVLVDNIEFKAVGSNEEKQIYSDLFVTDTEYKFTNLDMTGEHYYTLQAKKDTYLSPDYGREHVFGIKAPVALEATNIDIRNGSFTANWTEVNGALSYQLVISRRYEATKATSDFPVLSEDFSKLDGMSYTLDSPYYFDGSYVDDISHYTHINGWVVYGGALVAGMVGCKAESQLIYFVCTPVLDLSNGDATAKVYVKAVGEYKDRLRVQFGDEVQDLYFDENGQIDGYVELHNLTQGSIYFYSYKGCEFYLDEVKITQSLNAGDILVTQLSDIEVEGQSETSAEVTDIEVIDGLEYIYSVASYAYDLEKAQEYVSEPSNLMVVKFDLGSAERLLVTEATVRVSGREVTIDNPASIYDLQGRCLAQNTRHFTANQPGILIVKTNGKAKKLVIR